MRWTTPLGLPVVQPYRKLGRHLVSHPGELSLFLMEKNIYFTLFPSGCCYCRNIMQAFLLFNLASWVCSQIRTSLQVLTLQRETDKVSDLVLDFIFHGHLYHLVMLYFFYFFVQIFSNLHVPQVMVKRQRSAFPPNFVHSLDGSHMMMTAVACRKAGLNFAG